MANLSISGIRERIFNNTKHEQTVARSSNPFAAASFKGNVLTADVFAPEKSSVKSSQPSFTGKLKASALVGSLASAGSKISAAIESVSAFCNRMKDGVIGFWKNLESTEISLDFISKAGEKVKSKVGSAMNTDIVDAVKSRWNAMQDEHMVQSYLSRPTRGENGLKEMFEQSIGLVA
ncbi:MAG: hypothetical protein KH301_04220 [Brachyspira sp.]|uniref:hypothetical protein n=1 Tax=Candidatus Scatousia sp. TaxID=3085663 RepID=UPI00402565B6|nr:hypothetical protein [Brachyspira sp.]